MLTKCTLLFHFWEKSVSLSGGFLWMMSQLWSCYHGSGAVYEVPHVIQTLIALAFIYLKWSMKDN